MQHTRRRSYLSTQTHEEATLLGPSDNSLNVPFCLVAQMAMYICQLRSLLERNVSENAERIQMSTIYTDMRRNKKKNIVSKRPPLRGWKYEQRAAKGSRTTRVSFVGVPGMVALKNKGNRRGRCSKFVETVPPIKHLFLWQKTIQTDGKSFIKISNLCLIDTYRRRYLREKNRRHFCSFPTSSIGFGEEVREVM